MKKITVSELLTLNPMSLVGKIICFPTDTIYGMGVMIANHPDTIKAIERIYKSKRRPESKPLAILASMSEQVYPFVKNVSEEAKKLMQLWPGALTIIFEKKNGTPFYLTNNLPTIAFRIPNSQIALAIINHLGPLATTSVNISGMPSLNNLIEIENDFSDYIDYLIIDQEKNSGISSTVVKVSDKVEIIRAGSVIISQ